MGINFNRRQFIVRAAKSYAFLAMSGSWPFEKGDRLSDAVYSESLFDWSLWERYREKVQHPCLTIKKKNIHLAHENISHYEWARNYASNIERTAQFYLNYIDTYSLENLIEEITLGHTGMTPCPACRDQGKPVHPKGLWSWDIMDPDVITCRQCGTVFPHRNYPEDDKDMLEIPLPEKGILLPLILVRDLYRTATSSGNSWNENKMLNL